MLREYASGRIGFFRSSPPSCSASYAEKKLARAENSCDYIRTECGE